MLRSFADENEKLVEVPCPEPSGPATGVVWLDLLEPSREEDEKVEALLGISIPTRAEMAEIELSDRLYVENGAVFITVTVLSSLESDDAKKTPITFVLKDGQLITVRYADPKPIRSFLIRARHGSVSSRSGDLVMLGIFEAIIDRTADALERIADEIDSTSHQVFRNQSGAKKARTNSDLQALVESVGRKGDLLTKIQESLVSLNRSIAFWAAVETTPKGAQKEARARAKLSQRDATSLGEHANFLNSKVNFLLDATLGLINLEQNQIIKIFSVGSMVMLPPTLVASIYGMNFTYMPELDWPLGYPFALGLMVLSALLPFLYFKRKGWL